MSVGYAALGKAMVLMAEDENAVGKRVGVKGVDFPTLRENLAHVPVVLGNLIPGLLCAKVPPIWSFGRRLGLW